MKIRYVWEHNGNDTLLFAADFPGAYARGASRDEALAKLPDELRAFLRWTNTPVPAFDAPELVQEQESALQILDADSDVLFASEREPLTEAEYAALKAQVLRSAADFLTLYRSAPDENVSCLPVRQTFYGRAPRTANEMYAHTKNVNDYYFGGNRRRRRLRRHDLRMPAERLRGAGAARRFPAPSRPGRKLRRMVVAAEGAAALSLARQNPREGDVPHAAKHVRGRRNPEPLLFLNFPIQRSGDKRGRNTVIRQNCRRRLDAGKKTAGVQATPPHTARGPAPETDEKKQGQFDFLQAKQRTCAQTACTGSFF